MFTEAPGPHPLPSSAVQVVRLLQGGDTNPLVLQPLQPFETSIARNGSLAQDAAKQQGSFKRDLELAEIRSCPASGHASGPATPTPSTEPVVIPGTVAQTQEPILGKMYFQFTKQTSNFGNGAAWRSIADGSILKTAKDAFNNREDLAAQLLSMSTRIETRYAHLLNTCHHAEVEHPNLAHKTKERFCVWTARFV